jgi:hypothetical protein
MPRLRTFCLVVALSACTAANLSQLNSSYDTLIDKTNAGVSDGLVVPPSPVADAAGLTKQQGQEALQAQFGALAQAAYTLAGKASEPATQISAYRLAGLAAWQHDPSDPLVSKAQADGMAVCAGLTQGARGAPRDCAILRYLLILTAYQEIANAVNGLAAATPDNLKAIEDKWLAKIGGLATDETSAWSDVSSGNTPYSGISDTTILYFKAVTFVSACLVDIAHRKGEVFSDSGGSLPPGYDSAVSTVASQFLPVLQATGLLTDRNVTSWFGRPEMNCARFLRSNTAPPVLGAK